MSTPGPHLLGRKEPPDFAHLKYTLERAAPTAKVKVTLQPPTLSDYDQGQTPECVAYSTSRVMNWFNHYAFSAPWLYAACKKIDSWPGQDGTSARFACDVLRNQGHLRTIGGKPVKAGPQKKHGILANTWAVNVDGIRAVFGSPTPQPVLIGINWYEDWFTPQSPLPGEHWLTTVSRAGSVAGGHEIGIWACDDDRQAFGLRNTWGKAWPPLVWLAYEDMATLFAYGADACILQDAASR